MAAGVALWRPRSIDAAGRCFAHETRMNGCGPRLRQLFVLPPPVASTTGRESRTIEITIERAPCRTYCTTPCGETGPTVTGRITPRLFHPAGSQSRPFSPRPLGRPTILGCSGPYGYCEPGSTSPRSPRYAVNLSITLEQPDKRLALFGSADKHLRLIRDTFGVQVVSRDDELRLSGDKEQVSKAAAVLDQLQRKLRRQDWLSLDDVGARHRQVGRRRPHPGRGRDRRLRQGPRHPAQDRGAEAVRRRRWSRTT